MKKIILASASPRRKELLEQIGLQFEVESSNCTEDMHSELAPHKLAESLSKEKAMAVAVHHRNAIILAADTFIVLGDKIMGKPHTPSHARQMLAELNGKAHSVITGFTVLDTDENKTLSRSIETRVNIRKLTSEEIEAYVKSSEPLGKAGAYAIQGLGAVIIEGIEGDYSNVVGLPLNALVESLKEFGINIL